MVNCISTVTQSQAANLEPHRGSRRWLLPALALLPFALALALPLLALLLGLLSVERGVCFCLVPLMTFVCRSIRADSCVQIRQAGEQIISNNLVNYRWALPSVLLWAALIALFQRGAE